MEESTRYYYQSRSKGRSAAIIQDLKDRYPGLNDAEIMSKFEDFKRSREERRAELDAIPRREPLTIEEVTCIIDATVNERDRAMLKALYDSASRARPFLGLLIGDSVPQSDYLQEWLKVHPLKDNPDAPLWVSLRAPYERLSYSRLERIVKEAAKSAGIEKKVSVKSFRDAKAKAVLKEYGEAAARRLLGH